MAADLDYSQPGVFTTLGQVPPEALAALPHTPIEICRPVHSLVIQPTDAQECGIPEERFSTNQLRPAEALLQELLALDPRPVTVARPPELRIVGTCRHFALLSCALLQLRGFDARVRCGFATYFQPGLGLDHWITEYRDHGTTNWARIDSEILDGSVLDRPERLAEGQFLSGGEAWQAFRRNEIDASLFGVHGTENFGAAEIRGNAVKDLAALNKVEMLPWDEWGRMTEAYEGRTGSDYDELLDTLARTCAADEPVALAELYDHVDLRVPLDLLR